MRFCEAVSSRLRKISHEGRLYILAGAGQGAVVEPSETSLAGKASVCQGCPGQYLCSQQGGVDPDQEMIDLRMNAVKHKIIILSGKGGVGKSSLAATLSIALANMGNKVHEV